MKAALICAALAATCANAWADPASATITVIGTSDLHGALDRLPLLGGFVANVRAARAADRGGVVLVDGGDLFQGTLESNLAEGADVVRAYNQLGYAASAVGNHEFDFGPAGSDATPKTPGEDPRGALKARAHEAKFPFLVTNIVDTATGKRVDYPNMPASTLIDVAGVKVGILGASTSNTPTTTMPANFAGLKMALPTAKAIADEARALRGRGAQLVIAAMHIGSECKDNSEPSDLSSCDQGEELFAVLKDVPAGLVDVIVAGHTHAAVAKKIAGVAVIESLSSGRAFGRVDVHLTGGRVDGVTIHPPEIMCPLDHEQNPIAVADCHPAPYEGKPVVPDTALQKIADDAAARTATKRDERLGITLASAMTKEYNFESPEGDWFVDLMLAAEPSAQIAITNGGGLRADIPPGPLTYGELFRAIPFDNRFALVAMHGSDVRALVRWNFEHGGGLFSYAGLTASARCVKGNLAVDVDVGGKPIDDAAAFTIVTSDFLATGGDGSAFGQLKLPAGAVTATDVIIREAMADLLRKRGGVLDPSKDIAGKRVAFTGKRPLHCASGHGRRVPPN